MKIWDIVDGIRTVQLLRDAPFGFHADFSPYRRFIIYALAEGYITACCNGCCGSVRYYLHANLGFPLGNRSRIKHIANWILFIGYVRTFLDKRFERRRYRKVEVLFSLELVREDFFLIDSCTKINYDIVESTSC